jgi:CHAT domain-containing protein
LAFSRLRTFATGALLVALAGGLAQCNPLPRRETRPAEGRLVGMAWAPYRGRSERRAPMRRRLAATPAAGSSAAARRSAATALREADPDRAIRELQAAVNQAPRDASLWSDLAAACLARAEAGSDPYDLVLALAAAARAVEREPGLLAARFNLALALERFPLRAQAIREWEAVRRQERDPGWLQEATAHLAALVQPGIAWPRTKAELARAVANGDDRRLRALVTPWPQEVREYLEEELLPSWATAELAHHHADADRYLALARAIARQRLELTGERLDQEVVAQIDRLRVAAGGASHLELLAQAIRAYGQGLALINEGSFTLALPPLRSALSALEAQACPLASWANCQIGYCHYQRYEYDEALRCLLPLADDPRDRSGALRGRALWVVGLIHLIRGDLTAALTALTSASASFRRAGERGNEAMVGALVATNFASLGQRGEAWRALHSALRNPPAAPRIRAGFYGMAVLMAADDGELEVALRLQDEMLRSAHEAGVFSAVAEGLFDRACILIALGDSAGASSTLAEAARTVPRIPDPRTRRLSEGNILLAQGRLLSLTSPAAGVDRLGRAIAIFGATDTHWALGQALYQRALAERLLGRAAEEQRDLAAAIAESERQRERITPLEQRISYLDQQRSLIEAMVSLELERGLTAEALSYSERARSRVLLDWIEEQPVALRPGHEPSHRSSGGATPRLLRRQLPADVTLVEYWLARDRLDLWVMNRSRLETRHLPIAAPTLLTLVHTLNHAAAQADEAELSRTSAALYDALIRPIATLLPPGGRLVFVPDGPLHALSFALLRDSRTGRYLVEDHSFSVAPSAAIFTSCLHRDRQLAVAAAKPRALVVVDPAFDQQLYPSLPRLAGGDTEERIPQFLPGSRVLRGNQATRSAFLAAAGDFEIVHFGGHAVLNAQFPLLSQLVFASGDPATPDRGVLYSGEILGRRLARTRLVVLASCATAAGQVSRTEGIESITRPFLAAGVPAVIASLWSVDDDTTAQLFDRFYRNLAVQPDPVEALRAAQLDALANGSERLRQPSCWAAFELIGGGSSIRVYAATRSR